MNKTISKKTILILLLVLASILLAYLFFSSLLKSEYNQFPPFNNERGITFPYEFVDCVDLEENIDTSLAETLSENFNVLSISNSDLLLSIKSQSIWVNLSNEEKVSLLKNINESFRNSYNHKSGFVFIVDCSSNSYIWVGYAQHLYEKDLFRFDW